MPALIASAVIVSNRRTISHKTRTPSRGQNRRTLHGGETIVRAVVDTLAVAVAEFAPLIVTADGTVQEAKLGAPLQPNEIVPVNPATGVKVSV